MSTSWCAGSQGSFLEALLGRYPNARGVLFDLPEVCCSIRTYGLTPPAVLLHSSVCRSCSYGMSASLQHQHETPCQL